MTRIIGISGKKQSGKNTVANYITGHILKSMDMVRDFDLSNEGALEIETSKKDGQIGWGIFDLTRRDPEFLYYLDQEIWPFVKMYHFADPLKQICVELFDLEPRQVYGTDEDKNTPTPYAGRTSREFLQWFGTDIMRSIKDSIWVDYTIKSILKEGPAVALIPDVRFPNEVKAIKESGGTVIRLDRSIFESDHQCEVSLDPESYDWSNFDVVVNNDGKSLTDLCEELNKHQNLWDIKNASNIH